MVMVMTVMTVVVVFPIPIDDGIRWYFLYCAPDDDDDGIDETG